ncbi:MULTISPECIES: hypothetical protein [Clostridium]|uniref:hypothetical protein n=1 Tax=Clostridium TaxID=1485 RepID=UPI00189FDD7A|nr:MULTISPECIES: hypothetical protein [Clostridium]MDB2100561.1 hypothetical protein [Clostridium paraputrificum]MDU6047162.1 hypothetical protein [Clostridium sp.]MDU6220540.1 hypothetical protein [Clostridium sp.]MDU6270977.1 hypothetical protein [Clostridium sp.]MDU6326473.1 hypothetical protein [Clostridium sp.]
MKGQTFKIGNTTIIIRETTPNEDDIRRCYDVCNEIFRDRPECFYTREETREKNRLLAQQDSKRKGIV